MLSLARTAALAATMIVALAATAPGCSPVQASQTKEPTGSISGRVTIGDVPARGVTVLLVSAENEQVTVTNGTETQVTMLVDLNKNDR